MHRAGGERHEMISQKHPHLTKSKYTAGCQCDLRLWKQVFTPLPYEDPLLGTPQYEGTRIGKLAQALFPGGVLVDNKAIDHQGALARTNALMANGCPAIFEGAFEHDNRRIRVDILKNMGEGRWALYEVKSSTSIHPEHFHDASFQADVLRQSGINLISVCIVHVNNQYRRDEGPIDVEAYFQIDDIGDALVEAHEKLPSNLARMVGILAETHPPSISPGLHCGKPYACEFLDQCTKDLPKDWIGKLPRVTQAQLEKAAACGVTSISEVPDDMKLQGKQADVVHAHKTGKPYVSVNLGDELRLMGPPTLYLDFESMMPGMPLYIGTAPYQHIPFLFSLHISDDGNSLRHQDYIAPPGVDPRRPFAEALIRQTSQSTAPILVYSPYEKRIINELARAFSDLAPALEKIVERIHDLLGTVRQNIYVPAFNGSFSIKYVAPALAGTTYADLNIKGGSSAAAAYQQMVETPDMSRDEVSKTMSDLRSYCERDTQAMVDVHRAMRDLTKPQTFPCQLSSHKEVLK